MFVFVSEFVSEFETQPFQPAPIQLHASDFISSLVQFDSISLQIFIPPLQSPQADLEYQIQALHFKTEISIMFKRLKEN